MVGRRVGKTLLSSVISGNPRRAAGTQSAEEVSPGCSCPHKVCS